MQTVLFLWGQLTCLPGTTTVGDWSTYLCQLTVTTTVSFYLSTHCLDIDMSALWNKRACVAFIEQKPTMKMIEIKLIIADFALWYYIGLTVSLVYMYIYTHTQFCNFLWTFTPCRSWNFMMAYFYYLLYILNIFSNLFQSSKNYKMCEVLKH